MTTSYEKAQAAASVWPAYLADKLEQLAKDATPGPWLRLHDDLAVTTTVLALEPKETGVESVKLRMSAKRSACDCGQVWSVPADVPVAYCDTGHMGEGPTGPVRMANAALIVGLVNSLPEIIRALRGAEGASDLIKRTSTDTKETRRHD